MKKELIITLGFAIALVRIAMAFVEVTPTFANVYKDIAHLFVGGVFAAWQIQRFQWQKHLFWWLCIIEVTVAVATLS